MTLEQQKEILSKPYITFKNAMIYTGFGKTKVSQLIVATRKKYGNAGLTNYVRTEDFLTTLGTTLEKEVKRLNALHN